MKQSHQLLPILVCVVSLAAIVTWAAPTLLAGDRETAGIAVAPVLKTTNPNDSYDKVVFVKVRVSTDGEVLEVIVYHRSRTATLPGRDWRRSLDRHLGVVRVEYARVQPELWLSPDPPIKANQRSEFMDIVKRRGFKILQEEPRQTGYAAPATQKF
jgi:hypothetical protein